MKNYFKNKKILIALPILIIIAVIVGIIIFSKEEEKNLNNESTNNYIAYIKINPSIKLEYTQICNDDNTNCEEPIVTNYELINDDAKNIYKDIDLLDSNMDLFNVLDFIITIAKENNITVNNVDIYSDWKKLDNYIKDSSSRTWDYNISIFTEDELKEIYTKLKDNKNIEDDSAKNNSSGNQADGKHTTKPESSEGSTGTSNTNNSKNETDESFSDHKDLGNGFYYTDASGYGDYFGEGVWTVLSTYKGQEFKYYDFYTGGKFGCKDARDKQACKSSYINYLEPKRAEMYRVQLATEGEFPGLEAGIKENKANLDNMEAQLATCGPEWCDDSHYTSREQMEKWVENARFQYQAFLDYLEEAKHRLARDKKQVEIYDKILEIYRNV